MTMRTLIQDLVNGHAIESCALEEAIGTIMEGMADSVQVAGLLIALSGRPVQSGWLAGAARAIRAHRVAVRTMASPLVDTCGTGGDGAGTFNISTAAALVVASAGAAVAKHGNRSVSSAVGSADVIEAAGGALDLGPEEACRMLDATGFVFLFAPRFHPAMAHVAPVRRSLGVRTLFNLLGPLTNPALADAQLIGVYAPGLTEVMAEALQELGSESALVVHCDGLDEIGLHAVTRGHRLLDGRIEPFEFDPVSLGIQTAPVSALKGGDAACNVTLMRNALNGEPGPHGDVVVLNAAAALLVAGLVSSMAEGVELARDRIGSGESLRALDRFCESSRRLAGKGTP